MQDEEARYSMGIAKGGKCGKFILLENQSHFSCLVIALGGVVGCEFSEGGDRRNSVSTESGVIPAALLH